MDVNSLQLRDIIYTFHAIVSILVIIFFILCVFRSVKYRKVDQIYSKTDTLISLSAVLFLYLQLFLGVYLFFIKESKLYAQDVNIEQIIDNNFFRFWSVEHFILMLFALAIAQTGHVIIEMTSNNKQKYNLRLTYYLIVILLVVLSLVFAVLKN